MNANNKQVLSHSQNFLNNKSLVRKLVNESNLKNEDLVYEIGPGKGIITQELAEICSKVVAIEFDKNLYENLINNFINKENVEIIFGDFLKKDLTKGQYKVFSNIPFNITAEILSKITNLDNPSEDSFLIMQEEAAKKYAGFPYYNESLRSLMLKPYFEFKILYKFKNTDFSPIPKVNIVLLQIKKRDKFLIDKKENKKYADFISYTFSQHGKNLKERLSRIFTVEQFKRLSQELKFNILIRPVELNFEHWLGLFNYYTKGVSREKQALIEGANNKLISQQKKLDKVHRNRRGSTNNIQNNKNKKI